MKVTIVGPKLKAENAGPTHYICSAGCLSKFEGDPQHYLAKAKARAEVPAAPKAKAPEAPADAIYTCPMHPEIRQVGPGNCPICGMALEPETVTSETGPNPELIDMTRRFWI